MKTHINGANGTAMVLDFKAAGRLIGNLLTDDYSGDLDSDLPQIKGYDIDRLLARGGGGQVFLATRNGSDKNLALKLLNKSIGDRTAAERAWRELDVLTDLRLAGIPPVEDYGIHQDRMYIVTAHVEGLTLADHCTQKNLDRQQRVELLASVADCVQRLHEHGVIHRDIKPDNIIINRDGQPVIIDFGIASLLTENAAETLTLDGVPIGTAGFMAPEQAHGDRKHTSTRSDVYALGATACLVLTGKTPHDVSGPLVSAIHRVAHEKPPRPTELDPTIDRGLAAVLTRALASSPDERYPSAAAFAEDLRRWLRNELIEWQQPNWFRRQALAWRRDRKGFLTRGAIAALIVVCVGTTIAAVTNAQWAHEQQTLKESWEEQAREIHELTTQLQAREKSVIELRKKQQSRIQLGIAQGEFFPATLILLNMAEDIQAYAPDDKKILNEFVTTLNELCEAAKKQPKSPAQ